MYEKQNKNCNNNQKKHLYLYIYFKEIYTYIFKKTINIFYIVVVIYNGKKPLKQNQNGIKHYQKL